MKDEKYLLDNEHSRKLLLNAHDLWADRFNTAIKLVFESGHYDLAEAMHQIATGSGLKVQPKPTIQPVKITRYGNEAEIIILEYMEKYKKVIIREIIEGTKLDYGTVKYWLKRLRKENKIGIYGHSQAAYYALIPKLKVV